MSLFALIKHVIKNGKSLAFLGTALLAVSTTNADEAGRKHAENELQARPAVRITVALRNADIIGSDNRALQAAVDYVGNLGGGVVEIGPGEYLMRDALHLRSRVTARVVLDGEHVGPDAVFRDVKALWGTSKNSP